MYRFDVPIDKADYEWLLLHQTNRERIALGKGPIAFEWDKPKANEALREAGIRASADNDTLNVPVVTTVKVSRHAMYGLQELQGEWKYKSLGDLLEAIGWGLFVLVPQPLPDDIARRLGLAD